MGFSGGPVCYQVDGSVVGMFTAKDENYGFVIPIETILRQNAIFLCITATERLDKTQDVTKHKGCKRWIRALS